MKGLETFSCLLLSTCLISAHCCLLCHWLQAPAGSILHDEDVRGERQDQLRVLCVILLHQVILFRVCGGGTCMSSVRQT